MVITSMTLSDLGGHFTYTYYKRFRVNTSKTTAFT